MSLVRLLASTIAYVFTAAACSGIDRSTCSGDALLAPAGVEQSSADSLGDWRAELDSIVATAPADSVLDITVFVAVRERAAFVEWAARRQVPITYQYYGFSAFRIEPTVGDLPSLREQAGVTGVDWGAGPPGEPHC